MLNDDDKVWLKQWLARRGELAMAWGEGFACAMMLVAIATCITVFLFAEQWRHEWRQVSGVRAVQAESAQ